MRDRALILRAKSRLSMRALLDQLAPDWKRRNPIRADDKRNSFSADDRGWKDHGADEKGDQITFLMRFDQLDKGQAIRRFLELAGVVEETKMNGYVAKCEPVAQSELRLPWWPDCVAAFTLDHVIKMGAWRGLPCDFVLWLKEKNLIGIYKGHVAFAEVHPGPGTLTGVHYLVGKPEDKDWRRIPGTPAQPLIIGDPKASKWLVFESQWDAFVVMERLDFHLQDSEPPYTILVTRGAGNGKLASIIPAEAEVIVVMQNDEPKLDGKIAADCWLETIKSVCPARLKVARPPIGVDDCNDWLKSGDADFIGMLDDAKTVEVATDGISRKSLLELYRQPPNESQTLLGNRWLCRGGCALIVAPTGVGKSSASAQMDVCWTAGKPAFGITPAKPLRTLTIQVENDDGDLHEMVSGVIHGMRLTEDEIKVLGSNTRVVTLHGKVGLAFINQLDKELTAFPCDILRIDPVTGFFGGDVKDPKAVNTFCREQLQPLLDKHNCGLILILHTPKTSNRETSTWKDHDWMYAAAGAADWSNFARAILVIEPKAYPVFQFKATKRRQRIGWVDDMGNPVSDQLWSHSTVEGEIFWEPATAEQREIKSKPQKTKLTLLALVPTTGTIEKKALVSKARASGIGDNTAKIFIAELIHDGELDDVAVPRSKMRAAAHVQLKKPR